MRPTLFTETNNQMEINREEVFGPIACVIKAKSYEEALMAISNDSDFGLTSGIVTQSLKQANRTLSDIPNRAVSWSTCRPLEPITMSRSVAEKHQAMGLASRASYAKEFYTIVKTTYISA